ISATPIGRWGARSRRGSSGRTRATSSRSRRNWSGSRKSSKPVSTSRRPRPTPPRRRSPTADEPMPAARADRAPAKVNLTRRVVGRRADGYHDIESLVVFASVVDTLTFTRGRVLALSVRGPTAGAAGAVGDNLVLKAATALAQRIAGIKLGRFVLSK